nr:glycerol-3-phosphate dehydrogenase [Gemmatimonadaceae bacterium]
MAFANDRELDATFAVRAELVINCTGPWSDATAALTGLPLTHGVRGAVGAHIAVPRQRVGNRDAITLDSPVDGRV